MKNKKPLLKKSESQKFNFSKQRAGVIKGKKFDDLDKLREEYLKEKYKI